MRQQDETMQITWNSTFSSLIVIQRILSRWILVDLSIIGTLLTTIRDETVEFQEIYIVAHFTN